MTDPAAEAVVRVDRKTRMAMTICASLVVGVFLAAALLNAMGVIHRSRPTLVVVGFPILALTWAMLLIVGLHRSRVVLLDDAIEVTRLLWPTRCILRNDIGTRFFHAGGWRRSAYHVLVMRNGDCIALPPYLERNSVFQAFLAGIPLRSRMRKGKSALPEMR